MRISDWSSDVCSSDLARGDQLHAEGKASAVDTAADPVEQPLIILVRSVRPGEILRQRLDRARGLQRAGIDQPVKQLRAAAELLRQRGRMAETGGEQLRQARPRLEHPVEIDAARQLRYDVIEAVHR